MLSATEALRTGCQPSHRRSKGCCVPDYSTSNGGPPESVTIPVEESSACTRNKGAVHESSTASSSTTSTQSPQRNFESSSVARATCTSVSRSFMLGKTTEPFARDHLNDAAVPPS